LTRKAVRWEWTLGPQSAFDQLKQSLLNSPVLVYPDFDADFVMETDASIDGLGAILSQKKSDGKLHPVAYASRSTSVVEKHYSITELETLAVVWAVQHFRAYLYGHNVTVITDHSAVKAVLDKPGSIGKLAGWWLKIFSSGIGHVKIVHRPGHENVGADTLSRSPVTTETTEATDLDEFVLQVSSRETSIGELLNTPVTHQVIQSDLHLEQRKDSKLTIIIAYLEKGVLPQEEREAQKIVTLATNFCILDNVLYFIDNKRVGRRRGAVPSHLRSQIMEQYHGGKMSGHFSGSRLYATLCYCWWWENMYTDAVNYCSKCAECCITRGSHHSTRFQ